MSPFPGEAPSAGQPQDLLAQLRHDLLTPLNQIIGYSELLEEEAAAGDIEAGSPAAGITGAGAVGDLRRIQEAARAMETLLRHRLTHEVAGLAGQALERPRMEEPGHGGRPGRPGRILVVDDDPFNRDVLVKRLQRQGHTLRCASDGLEALEAMRFQSFDLVLLDMLMPRLDGIGTLARLKDSPQWRHIPVIMISALDELGSVVRCIEAGAEDYLPKPFNPTLLRARIGACLEKKLGRDQEIALYESLRQSQERLQGELLQADAVVSGLAPELRQDGQVAPLLAALERMAAALSRGETDLRATIQELEIKINRQALSSQVRSIVSDPSFSQLSERARAMRSRRQNRRIG